MDYRNVPTICVYCGAGCGLFLEVLDGEVIGTYPDTGHPIGQGSLCVKGWNNWSFIHHQDRLKKPLIKKEGRFVEASWDEALNLVADKLREAKEKHGPDALGFLCSAKCTNEDNYVFQKFVRAVIGTNNVDHCARL